MAHFETHSEIPLYFRYWGKAKKDPEYQGADYHLLPYHCLDVAAVGWCLLDPKKSLCKRLSHQLEVAPEWLCSFFSFCLILHDIGKFARGFQNLAPDLSPDLVPKDISCGYKIRHDSLGFLWWKKLIKQLSDELTEDDIHKLEPWLEIVCGHHGQPPKRANNIYLYDQFLDEDEQAVITFVKDSISCFMPSFEPIYTIDKKKRKAISWLLAGVAVFADWLGSDQQIFQYQSNIISLEEYWRTIALKRAIDVISQIEWNEQSIAPFQSIQQLFPFIDTPTPLQNFAQTISIQRGGNLFILEDVTGSGKTEAANILVHRLMSAGNAKGVYLALPTMATANGMYQRMRDCYQSFYQADGASKPSLVLAHGASQLSKLFIDSVGVAVQAKDKSYGKGKLVSQEQTASSYCNAWLADSRKKSLLANVGVGTIDQALLAVLPARHQSLRLLGLSDKVLLVDEVHAYDPYMSSLLCALLEAHAQNGGSVILLSATLPKKMRSELVASFAKGLQQPIPELVKTKDYPLLTHFSEHSLKEYPIATRDKVRRSVKIEWLDSEDSAITLIEHIVSQGGCICWVRNTVQDARIAFEKLKQIASQNDSHIELDKLTLFHSRFTICDRQVIENDVICRFGNESKLTKDQIKPRQGQILIATQVVEQSLDLDFDYMISDLAPIDLLIQRAGRLQRHSRDNIGRVLIAEDAKDERSAACLHLLSPSPDDVVDDNWLKKLLPGSEAVYRNVGQMWLTANILLAKKKFSMPDDARSLIEGVYGDTAQNDIPDVLLDKSYTALGEQKSKQSMGQFNQLQLEKGYTIGSADRSGGWDEDVNIPTRLQEKKSVIVAIARVENNVFKPYAMSAKPKDQWALSQLSVPEHEWEMVQAMISDVLQQEITRLKESVYGLKWVQILPSQPLKKPKT